MWPQKYVVNSSTSPILRILRYPDAPGDLIRSGEAYAMNFLGQGIRVLSYRLDGQIPIRLVDANSSPGTDPMAVKEEHDLTDVHPFLPGSGNPLPTLCPNTINGFQVGRVFLDYVQHLSAEVFDQLLRQDRANSLYEAASQIPFDPLARGGWDGFQDLSLELKTMLFISDPPAFCAQPPTARSRGPLPTLAALGPSLGALRTHFLR